MSSKNKNHRKLLLRELTDQKKFCGFHVCDIDDDGPERKILFKIPNGETLVPLTYCNGLFLLPAGTLNLALWNPTTRRSRNIPSCPIKQQNYHVPRMRLGLGLGYDSTADDYKVVQIDHAMSSHSQGNECQARIFGLKTSLWRRVADFPYIRGYSCSKFAYFANGNLHWLYQRGGTRLRRKSQEQHIVAFDVAKETFSQVTQPVYSSQGYVTGLHVLDECLCISFSSYTIARQILYVRWKDGAEFKWSILYSVTTDELPPFLELRSFRNIRVLGYLKGGNKIMLDFGLKFMVSYDIKEKYFAKEYNIGAFYRYRFDNPIIFTESLVIDTRE